MPGFPDHFQPLYDQKGTLLGVWLSPELWKAAQSTLSPAIDKALEALSPQEKAPPPEPMKDWDLLAQYWDFQYPMPMDVRCELCNNQTGNWMADEPRKFRLKAANIGGLVSFECQSCRARIIKKHFKKHVDVETRPFIEK